MSTTTEWKKQCIKRLAHCYEDKRLCELRKSAINDVIENLLQCMNKEDIQEAQKIFLDKIGWEDWMGDYNF